MTDRELLELAAKAAGIGEYIGMCADAYQLPEDWNPLANDGDALRLAVKLMIDLAFDRGGIVAVWINEDISETHTVRENSDDEFEGTDARREATRRAIVRAAAEIGKEITE